MNSFFLKWLILALSMLGASLCLQGVSYDAPVVLLEAALLFGFMSALLAFVISRPSIQPFFQKIGLFTFLTNAGLIFLVSKILPSFHLEHFSTALWGSAFVALISFLVSIAGSFKRISRAQAPPKIKTAKAKVISSKRNQKNP